MLTLVRLAHLDTSSSRLSGLRSLRPLANAKPVSLLQRLVHRSKACFFLTLAYLLFLLLRRHQALITIFLEVLPVASDPFDRWAAMENIVARKMTMAVAAHHSVLATERDDFEGTHGID